MHETGLVRDLIGKAEQAARANGARRVVAIAVWLGALSHLSAGHFRAHFDAESRGTLAEGARLDITLSTDPAEPNAQHLVLVSLELDEAG